jgi:hypothetical protein
VIKYVVEYRTGIILLGLKESTELGSRNEGGTVASIMSRRAHTSDCEKSKKIGIQIFRRQILLEAGGRE